MTSAFPSAFPSVEADNTTSISYGMSLRDYFAAKALLGLLASEDPNEGMSYEDITDAAYRYADAMLKARES